MKSLRHFLIQLFLRLYALSYNLPLKIYFVLIYFNIVTFFYKLFFQKDEIMILNRKHWIFSYMGWHKRHAVVQKIQFVPHHSHELSDLFTADRIAVIVQILEEKSEENHFTASVFASTQELYFFSTQ